MGSPKKPVCHMTRGLSPPNILLAATNPLQMIQNLKHLLEEEEIAKLTADIDRNVTLLFTLGRDHITFAIGIENKHWRQKISRLYYAVYNFRRALMLKHSGHFSTDSSDHKSVNELPNQIDNRESHIVSLKNLREDRNLSDYSHLAKQADLVISPDDALTFAKQFEVDCRKYLTDRGVRL
jgi:uncharacterized protein (UPF0332 family)